MQPCQLAHLRRSPPFQLTLAMLSGSQSPQSISIRPEYPATSITTSPPHISSKAQRHFTRLFILSSPSSNSHVYHITPTNQHILNPVSQWASLNEASRLCCDTSLDLAIMAWNASGAWKSPLNQNIPNSNDSSFPGLNPTTPDAAPKIDNTEIQENELLALEAIYGEDFVNHTGGQSAWKVCNPLPPAVTQLRLCSHTHT